MRNIERLLRRAKKVHDLNGKMLTASVDYDEHTKKFCAGGMVYSPKGSSPDESFGAEFDTLQEALAYVDELEAKYQACDNLTFIIDDLTFPEDDALYLKQINEQEAEKERR